MSVQPQEAMRKRITDSAAVTALIGSRYYTIRAPQNVVFPFVVCGVESEEHVPYMGGQSGHVMAKLTLAIWGATYESVRAIAEAIRNATNEYHGTITVSAETETIHIMRIESANDESVDVEGSDKPVYRVTQNWVITMTQATS